MRIIGVIQDAHAISDITKAQGVADFRARPTSSHFIDTSQALENPPLSTPLSRLLMTSKLAALGDGTERIAVAPFCAS